MTTIKLTHRIGTFTILHNHGDYLTVQNITTKEVINNVWHKCVINEPTTKGATMKQSQLRIKGKFVTAYDYKAYQLALLLVKANKVMTSKAKPFYEMLRIAYKMLSNKEHFAYVLKSFTVIKQTMLYDVRVSCARFNDFIDVTYEIFQLAPYGLS